MSDVKNLSESAIPRDIHVFVNVSIDTNERSRGSGGTSRQLPVPWKETNLSRSTTIRPPSPPPPPPWTTEVNTMVRRYRVQLFNRSDVPHTEECRTLTNVRFTNMYMALEKHPLVINCDDQHAIVELTVADENDNFTGMEAVLFHFEKKFIPSPLPPPNMNPDQIWIYYSYEPHYKNARESGVPNANFSINAMWSYHRSSEVFSPYGRYNPNVPTKTKVKQPEEWIKGKTNMVAWIASNCNSTSWPRYKYVEELKKHVGVDMYGKCGDMGSVCDLDRRCAKVLKRYKFYLALESSECEDYLTEKLWDKPLRMDIIPIVYGPSRKTYEDLVPPNSFIYIGDYASPKELASYLKLLDTNPGLYSEYFAWQYEGSIEIGPAMSRYDPPNFCNAVPVIERFQKGGLRKRVPYKDTEFAKTCRIPDNQKFSSYKKLKLEGWKPWHWRVQDFLNQGRKIANRTVEKIKIAR